MSILKSKSLTDIDKYFDPKKYTRIEESEFIKELDRVMDQVEEIPSSIRGTEIY